MDTRAGHAPITHGIERGGARLSQPAVLDIADHVPVVEGEAYLSALVESSSDGIFSTDLHAHITTWNRGAERIFGYTAAEMIGHTPSILIPEESLHTFQSVVQTLIAGEEIEPFTSARRRKDGTLVHVALTLSRIVDRAGRFLGVLIIARDVTGEHERREQLRSVSEMLERRVEERTAELVRSNEELVRSERARTALSLSNRMLVRATDEDKLMRDVCETVVSVGGYRMAWVGSLSHDEARTIVPVTWCGFENGYLGSIRVTWDESPTGQGPGGRCVRERRPVVTRDTETDSGFVWKQAASDRGYRSSAAFPLLDHEGTPFGILAIYSGIPDVFDSKEVGLLEELASDLAFGVMSVRIRQREAVAEAELVRSHARLEQMVYQVAETMGKIVEARDPYTKGHEVRVAKLAEMVAVEMGCSADDAAGVGMASLLHDIGKLRVPTEILSKPGRLSEAEFALIKEHSQGGYDILHEVMFPWPVAYMVLQHHERLDGSGYPQGLSGDEIIAGARILAVCDVVEAMASYRPYRAALGLDAAMREVTSRPDLYDVEVVAACVRLRDDGRLAFLDADAGS